MQVIRLGQIDFINCLPFNYALDQLLQTKTSARAPLFLKLYDFQITKGSPAELNQLLYTRDLDIAPISSIEYLRHREHYHLISDMAISSKAAVESVLFLSKEPLDKLRDIYVTDKSASSVALLKILAQEKYHLRDLNFITTNQLDSAPNKLVIGDEALKLDRSSYPIVLDLGLEWYEFSKGLPMVFGVWAYHKSFNMQPSVLRFMTQLKTEGLSKYFPAVLAQAAETTGLSQERVQKYFDLLDYDFNARHEASLALFEKHLAAVC